MVKLKEIQNIIGNLDGDYNVLICPTDGDGSNDAIIEINISQGTVYIKCE